MSDNPREIIPFPCEIAVKAMGKADSGFEAMVVEIVRRHAPCIEEGSVSSKLSSAGKFLSVTVRVNAHSRAQMDALYQELSDHEAVAMVL